MVDHVTECEGKIIGGLTTVSMTKCEGSRVSCPLTSGVAPNANAAFIGPDGELSTPRDTTNGCAVNIDRRGDAQWLLLVRPRESETDDPW
ncbi:MAG: hypothetical protein AAFR76_11655 [Planctomycetota bacterium]